MQKIVKVFEKYLFKIRWRLMQSLSLIPKYENSSISDLFFWVVDDEWETFFDLSPTIKLFEQSPLEYREKILIIIFDSEGKKIESKACELNSLVRRTIKISDFFEEEIRGHGTFAVFHLDRPEHLKKIHSYVAERGYLSFSYRGSKLRSYVHGNMDSVALSKSGEIEYLGNAFIWNREYRLQYLLGGSQQSKIILVNSNRKKLIFTVRIIDADSQSLVSEKKIPIISGGVATYDVPSTIREKIYLVIQSKSIMARPVVIDYQTQGVNVFHG